MFKTVNKSENYLANFNGLCSELQRKHKPIDLDVKELVTQILSDMHSLEMLLAVPAVAAAVEQERSIEHLRDEIEDIRERLSKL